MTRPQSIFAGKHAFLPVIHVEGGTQALRNVRIAREGGADGVFLINHRIPSHSLFECYQLVRDAFPTMWIGMNCLDLGMFGIEDLPKTTSGFWLDNAGIREDDGNPLIEASRFARLREASGWKGTYFGGVAFKYQTPVKDIRKVAELAVPLVDVITTSGPGTGEAADIGKIREMRKAIGEHPLAIASGITPENVSEYMPFVNCFLVATGISDSHTELNPARVSILAKALGK